MEIPDVVLEIIRDYAASMELYERKRRMQLELMFVVRRWHRRQMVLGLHRIATYCYLH